MFNKKIILGTSSPRRIELIQNLGFDCEVRKKEVAENYPETLPSKEVAEFLSRLKAEPLKTEIKPGEILLTSDTVVLLNNEILGKPTNASEAEVMLRRLSDNFHEVITGVFMFSTDTEISFSVSTKVFFKKLTPEEIRYYIDTYKPFDKAGAYGIQEWIGQIAVQRIEGCFYNVMGLPVNKVWEVLHQEFQ
ncbi:MAG: Maf family nucleotide pyrophosphatase [Brumimicrobium sp.]|nr:Maf family nucleotide pyrophosphatase [Brumimicrobium sp.]